MQVLLALAVVELGLQIVAFVVQRTTRGEMSSERRSGDLRILCIGDSNTYGVLVPRDETWPSQLQTMWNEEIGSPQIEVLNLGFPGTNSSRLVRDLPRLLETLRPDVTIIMVGVNDFWTLPFSTAEVQRPVESFWQRHSKLYRFYYLVKKGLEGDEIEIELDPSADLTGGKHVARIGDQEFQMSWEKSKAGQRGDRRGLRRNLETLVEQAKAGRTRLTLMTYPSRFQRFYKTANLEILHVAAGTGTPLINLTKVFRPICPEIPCPSHLLFDDHHPNSRGYQVVASTIKDHLLGQLHERPPG